MSTDEETKNMARIFYKYYYRRKIDYSDVPEIRKLIVAGALTWTDDGVHLCAEATNLGRHVPYMDPKDV